MRTKLENNVLKIDALLREATAIIWKSLPPERRNGVTLQDEALRLIVRVIENFSDDLTAFTEASAGNAASERSANTGKPWSAQADEESRALFESGNTVSDLSLYFQRTENGIRGRLVKLGLLGADEFRPRFAA